MKIRSYCIGSLKDIELMPLLERCQFTLNGHMSPSKREAAKALSRVKNGTTEIYVHYDFIRTIPRYPVMKESQKKEMVKEIVSILDLSSTKTTIKGIVIHMDSCFKQDMLKELFSLKNLKSTMTPERLLGLVTKHMNSPMYADPMEICNMIMSLLYDHNDSLEDLHRMFLLRWNAHSLSLLHRDILQEIGERAIINPCKIFIENTSHLSHAGGNPELVQVAGTVAHNAMLVSMEVYKPLFGICWDTEHAYASGDFMIADQEKLKSVIKLCPNLLIHLNTIEKGVTRGSFKDRHSDTTVFECSVYEPLFYFELVDALDSVGVPYLREVKMEAMHRELETLHTIDNATN